MPPQRKSSLPTALSTIDLLLKLDRRQLSLSLEIVDYATFALKMQLKMSTLCVETHCE